MKLQLISTSWQSCFTKSSRFICPLNLNCFFFLFLIFLYSATCIFPTMCFYTNMPLLMLHPLSVMLFFLCPVIQSASLSTFCLLDPNQMFPLLRYIADSPNENSHLYYVPLLQHSVIYTSVICTHVFLF